MNMPVALSRSRGRHLLLATALLTTIHAQFPGNVGNIICPAANLTTYTSVYTRQVFNITCGSDSTGDTLVNTVQSTTFQACVEACTATTGCTDVSFVGTTGAGTCYMKNPATGPPSANAGIQRAALWYTLPLFSCPNDNGAVYNLRNGANATVECFTDHAGGDAAMTITSTLEACITTCANTAGCVDVSYAPGSGGLCYLKNTLATGVTNYGVWGARMLTQAASGGGAFTASCPEANGTVVTDANGATWTIECGQDRAGNDFEQLYFNSLVQCLSACSAIFGCVDVSYIPGQNGRCYLKNAQGTAYNNPGVWGARLTTNETIFPAATADYATWALEVFGAGTSGCGSALPAGVVAGQSTQQYTTIVTKDGVARQYILYIPANYSPNKPSPLIIGYHGNGEQGSNFQSYSGWSSNSGNPNYIVAYPTGTNSVPSGCCSWQGATYSNPNIDDIAFTKQLLNNLTATYCVDPTRVYAAGHSNGGGFVGTLACDPVASRMFAAYGANSGAFYPQNIGYTSCTPWTVVQPCNAGRTRLPFLEIHGTSDGTIPYLGGPHNSQCLATVPQYVSQLVAREGFEPNATNTTIFSQAVTTNVTGAVQYQWGTSGVGPGGNPGGTFGEVTHFMVPTGIHTWQSNVNGFYSSNTMMSFFANWTLYTG